MRLDDTDEDEAPNEIVHVEVAGPVAVVGDVHGRADLLDALCAQLGPMPLFFVGDLGDRGPDSRAVVPRLIEKGARGVRGNHEEWLRAYLDGRGFDRLALTPGFGGAATLASYGIELGSVRDIEAQRRKVPPAHRLFLLGLPLAMRLTVDGT